MLSLVLLQQNSPGETLCSPVSHLVPHLGGHLHEAQKFPVWGRLCVVMYKFKYGMVRFALDKGISKAQICRDLEISKTSLYRIIGEL